MTDRYVFDTEPLIAFLYNEPGHETVASLLTRVRNGDVEGNFAEMNAGEVFYLLARFEGTDADRPTPESLRIADRDVGALEREGLHLRRADWRLAAEIKAYGSLSYADAHAVALASELDATLVVGADADFENLPVDIKIEQIRDSGV